MAARPSQCVKCRAALVPAARGRKPRYCSVACRRLAELEIRRRSQTLDKLESERSSIESAPGPGLFGDLARYCGCLNDREHLAHLGKAIAAEEAGLRRLFEGEGR